MAKTRIAAILKILAQTYPQARCALVHEGPFQLLVATILSAQCTDVRVNLVTPQLFAHYPNAATMAAAPLSHLEQLIASTGFFRNKAKSLQGSAAAIMAQHGGEVPADMDALTALPGVARKTANVVLGVGFGKAVGIVVDTHVTRLSQRLGLTIQTQPVKIEQDLVKIIPKRLWTQFSLWLIEHGRAICKAQRPLCELCPLAALCPSCSVPAPSGRTTARRGLRG